MAAYSEELAQAIREIEALPLVNSVVLAGEIGAVSNKSQLNSIRVRAHLSAAFVADRKRRHPYVACSIESKRPTQLDAAKALLTKVKEEYEDELKAAFADCPTMPSMEKKQPCAFDALFAARLAKHSLERAAFEASIALERAVADEKQAAQARQQAEGAVATAKKALSALDPKGKSHKRQCRGFDAPPSNQARETLDEASPDKADDEDSVQGGLYWEKWSAPKWKELEQKIAKARSVPLSIEVPARRPSEMPRGSRDGPLEHERHGMIGALQYWAEGSAADAA